ncbi:hypothetical protein [Leisingera methylohalidivorans]|uniref:Uncharacterized protein n=1 Tax=Leisingera methylohalidivorans DSM 14336 TaxID=999552 RepID=V9W0K7_9RHOB|nr:hypothetical protein [Leisingera methylohalidivorans]AHD03170.1 hypothetical protein METH_15500 [Leisingera methylohalidivorans DSM 14336]
MTSPGDLSSCSSAIQLLITGTAVSGSPLRIVQLQCSGSLQLPLCEALANGLQKTFPDAAITAADRQQAGADLTLRFVEQSQAADWVSGSLAWQHSDGRSGQGPVIEQSVMDGPLTADDLSDFAGQLLQHTELPL